MGSNSGAQWAVSATQKPVAPALSLTQAQQAPSLPPAAATSSPRTPCAQRAWGDRLLAGAASISLLSSAGLCSIASQSCGALCPSWQKPGNEKAEEAQGVFLGKQKGCEDYYCALPARRQPLERKGQNLFHSCCLLRPQISNKKLDSKVKKASQGVLPALPAAAAHKEMKLGVQRRDGTAL